MVKKLDLYIIRKFLSTFFFMIVAFVVIAVVFDISDNVDNMIKSNAPWHKIIIDYYLNFCFYFGNLLSSFIIFLTIIWFTSKLAQQSEIVAMLSSGISYRRIIRPYFISATILVALSLVLSHYVVPYANRKKYDFEMEYLKYVNNIDEKNVHREIEPGTIAYFYQLNPSKNNGSKFCLEKWDNGQLRYKLMSDWATFNPGNNTWTLENSQIRTYALDGKERLEIRAKLDTMFNMTIEDFGTRSEIASAMSWAELNTYISEQQLAGSGKAQVFEIEKYNRTAGPFAIFVLTLIGVSIASRKQRGGTGLHLMLAVIIGFIFIFISRIATVSAINLNFPVYIAVWVPSFLFSFVGLWLYGRAQK
jgi:lipopolysaccharide export system permease protein